MLSSLPATPTMANEAASMSVLFRRRPAVLEKLIWLVMGCIGGCIVAPSEAPFPAFHTKSNLAHVARSARAWARADSGLAAYQRIRKKCPKYIGAARTIVGFRTLKVARFR